MKKSSLVLMLFCGLLFLSGCSTEPETTEYARRNQEIVNRYWDKVTGQWYFEKKTSEYQYYSTYDFRSDGTFTSYTKEVTLHPTTASVDSTKVEDDSPVTERNYIGRWGMGWTDDEDFDGKYIFTSITNDHAKDSRWHRIFTKVDADTLVFQDWWSPDLLTFLRGNPGPSF